MIRRHLAQFLAIATLLIAHASAPTQLASQNQPATDVGAIIQHGEELNAQGKYSQAIAEFERAIDLDGRNSHAFFRLAESEFKLGILNGAGTALKVALGGDLRPTWIRVWAYINLGRIYDIRGQRYRAIPLYRMAVDTGDDSFGAQAEAKKCLDKPCEERVITWPSS